jgi:predicted permease
VLVKVKVMPDSATQVLSKLENNLFIPALVMGTFMTKFTPDSVTTSGVYLLCGLAVVAVTLPLAVLVAKCFSKDSYLRKIYTYGLAFSNFGFMGNAVVQALFPDVFMNYLIFVLPFWAGIYVWGVPFLLMPAQDKKRGVWDWVKPFVNPMFIGMIIGIVLGLTALPVPKFAADAVDTLGSCMSPVAMLLTGMTIAKIDLKKAFSNVPVYFASLVRLVVPPVAAILVLGFVKLAYGLALCIVCNLAMPLGLSPVVVPAGFGKDTSDAAGMALISHLLSCITIPLVFLLFTHVIA